MLRTNLRRSILATMTIAAVWLCAAPGVSAGAVPDDPYLAVVNVATNPASPAFVDEVKASLTTVPATVKSQMKDAGEHSAVGKHISDVFPSFLDSTVAGFDGITGTVGIGEFVTSNGIDYIVVPDASLKHEMGHAFDQAVVEATGQSPSSAPGFTSAYVKDLSEMPESVKSPLAYYIQGSTPATPSVGGRAEAFAEIFEIRYGAYADSPIDDLIRQYFDDTVAWENGLLPPRLLDAVSGAATDATEFGATLHGSVDPFGVATAYRFDYGPTSAYGASTPVYDAGSGTGDVPAAANLSGLAPSTTYHYRIVALRWGVPLLYGADREFTTRPQVVVTHPPVNVSPPAVVGTPTPGVMLSCAPGRWSDAQSFAYEWLRDGVRAASGASYAVDASDVGHQLACRVTASNRDGASNASSAPVTVRASAGGGTTPSGGGTAPNGGGTTPSPPRLTQLILTPARFRAVRSGPSALARGKTGALVTFRLDKPATVTFTVERSQPGRVVKGSCRAQTRVNLTAKRCIRWVAITGSFTWAARAGANSLRFSGRLAGRRLAAGSYLLIALPRDRSGSSGQFIRAAFRIRR